MALIARLYARRIVNINVNIILAGVLAMGLTLIPVHFSRRFTDHKPTIIGITFISDVVFDVVIYYVLHWLANHMPVHRRKRAAEGGLTDLSFLKDASLVQFERALLAPLYYGVAMGLQWVLLLFHPDWREIATAAALMGGILTTRTLHTFWMLRQERRRERLAASHARPAGPGPVVVVPGDEKPAAAVDDPAREAAARAAALTRSSS